VFGESETTDTSRSRGRTSPRPTPAETANEVLENWDRIKRTEEGRGGGEPFGDVPENLPALLYARKMQRRAVSSGLTGEQAEARLPDGEARDAAEHWLGDALFGLVDVARRLRVDPELALRSAAQRFRDQAAGT
jgi:XTP/dITP diphosphohydrolase/tetrapyrrole methylase family protein/MazG family protein/ATP diphosphatase